MRGRFNLLFYLKKPKKYERGNPVPIYMRLSICGRRTEFSTTRKCDPAQWNSSGGKANGSDKVTQQLNAFLNMLRFKVYEAQHQLIERGEIVSTDTMRQTLKGEIKNSKMLLEVFRSHNEHMQTLVGVDFAAGTMERYETACSHTRKFIKWKFNLEDIEIKKLNYEFVTEMEFYLKTQRKCCHNTAIKYISNLKKIVNICIRNGWLQRDPFFGYKMRKQEVIREFLSEEEIAAVIEKKFYNERLIIVRDIFIFSCFTGFSYADIRKLTTSEIFTGVDGDKWISTTRQKTEAAVRIPLLPTANAILEKYKNHPKCVSKNLLLPVLSNQQMNCYLREIADLAGIKKQFTFHCARHTFATTVTLCNGVPIETVSKMLGHSNITTTQIYAKIVDTKISRDMQELKRRLQIKTKNNSQD